MPRFRHLSEPPPIFRRMDSVVLGAAIEDREEHKKLAVMRKQLRRRDYGISQVSTLQDWVATHTLDSSVKLKS